MEPDDLADESPDFDELIDEDWPEPVDEYDNPLTPLRGRSTWDPGYGPADDDLGRLEEDT